MVNIKLITIEARSTERDPVKKDLGLMQEKAINDFRKENPDLEIIDIDAVGVENGVTYGRATIQIKYNEPDKKAKKSA